MDEKTTTKAPLSDREAHRVRLIELRNEIAAIKAEITAFDRRRRRGRIDARRFHRAKTALRHKQKEAAEIELRLAASSGRKGALKDRIIEAARADATEATKR